MTDEIWISVDVEASGPSPSVGSLLSIGACVVDNPDEGIEVRLRPDPAKLWDEAAEAVHHLDRETLMRDGQEPREALEHLEAWLARVVPAGARPVFVALNAPFDWMWVADAFWRHLGRNPFGISALDIKALYLGRHLGEVQRWADTGRVAMLERYPVDLPHTHEALDDAREQAAILRRIRDDAVKAKLAAGLDLETAPGEQQVRDALDAIVEAYAIYRPEFDAAGEFTDSRIVFANRAWQRFFLGAERDDLEGMSLYALLPALRMGAARHAEVFKSGQPHRAEVEVATPLGRRLVDLNMARAGNRVVAFLRDITEQRRAESALIESREMLRRSMDAVIEGYGIYRGVLDEEGHYVDGIVVYANEVWKLQYSPDDPAVEGRSLYAFPGARNRFAMHARVFETGEPYRGQVAIATRDGPRVLDLQMEKFGEYFVGSSRDITGQRAAEEALRDSVRRYREVLEGIDAIVWEEDAARGGWFVVGQSERLTGYSAEGWADAAVREAATLPDDRARVLAALTGPDDTDLEFRVRRADGQVRVFRDRMRVVHDPDGEVVRRYGVMFDVTERRELQDRVRRSERFSSMGELSAAVAHDFDNVLYGIGIFGRRLLASHPDPADSVHADAFEIVRAVESAGQLTRSLLGFAREQPAPSVTMVVDDVIRAMVPMLDQVVGRNVELAVHLHAASAAVPGEPAALQQALLNLAINARDAMPKGGHLDLETRVAELDAEDAETMETEPGRGVIVTVRDTGIGMDEKTRSRVFEPYFTTKAVGVGTGLGLATVYGMVKAIEGGISVESVPGRGTAFQLFLPSAVSGRPS